MADKPFRILLDVRSLFLKDFKFVWVTIYPSELSTISDVKKFIIRRINLERDDIQLFVNNGILLEDDLIDVLERGDTVRVNFKTPLLFSNLVKDSLEENTNYSQKRTLNESDLNDEEAYQPKSKSSMTLDATVAVSNNDARQSEKNACIEKNKNKSFIVLDETVAIDNNGDAHQSERNARINDKNNTSLESTVLYTGNVIDNNETVAVDNRDSHQSERNTRINDKNNTSLETTVLYTGNVIHLSSDSQIKTCNFDERKLKKHRKETSSRISFTAQPNACSTPNRTLSSRNNNNSEQEENNTSLDSTVLNVIDVSSDSPIKPFNFDEKKRKRHRMNNNNNSNLSSSDNGSVLLEKPDMKNAYQTSHKIKTEEDFYESLPDLNSLPALGVSIAYKVLELSEKYCPVISDYRKGIVEKVNYSTGDIEVRLVEDIIVPGRTGRSENLAKDKIPKPIIKKREVRNWNDLVHPKIYLPI